MVTGWYQDIQWQKNAVSQTIVPQQFPNYNEILVYSTTTQADLGLYEMSVGSNPFTQLVAPPELDFNVISPGMACNDYCVSLGHSCNSYIPCRHNLSMHWQRSYFSTYKYVTHDK